MQTFELGQTRGQPWILCRVCGHRSYHPNDIVQRYCGHCHQFHDDLAMRPEAPGLSAEPVIADAMQRLRGLEITREQADRFISFIWSRARL